MLAKRSKLPAYEMREHIVKTVRNALVVVVSGETGCGKTTQVRYVPARPCPGQPFQTNVRPILPPPPPTCPLLQVPQLVLDTMIGEGEGASANIIVTQPRRISAVGVAERIAAERAERIGETAG
ncbi:unnamed protein product [Scytosiphon promiscuus]